MTVARSGKRESSVGEEKQERPRREASDPERAPAPGDEVPPGTEGAAETICEV